MPKRAAASAGVLCELRSRAHFIAGLGDIATPGATEWLEAVLRLVVMLPDVGGVKRFM
jgi:hypothetical protein